MVWEWAFQERRRRTPRLGARATWDGAWLRLDGRQAVAIRLWPHPAVEAGPGHPKSGVRARRLVECVMNALDRASWPDPAQEVFLPRRGAFAAVHTERALAGLVGSLPGEVRTAVAAHRLGRWRLLCFLATGPAAQELWDSNPALAFALAHADVFRPGPAPGAAEWARLVAGKRRAALGELGFPATDLVERILRRLPAGHVDTEVLLILRRLVRDPALARRLSHLPALGRDAVLWARLPGVAEKLSASCWAPQGPFGCDRGGWNSPVVRIESDLPAGYVRRWGAALPRFRHWIDFMCRGGLRALLGWQLPLALRRPPLPGTPTIQPLRSLAEFRREAAEMQSCLAGMDLEPVTWGEWFFYRVLAPGRATVLIARERPNPGWGVHMLRGPRNEEVAPETRAAVDRWLRETQGIEPPSLESQDPETARAARWGPFIQQDRMALG